MVPSTRCWLAMNLGRRPRGLLVEGEEAAGIGPVGIEMEVEATAEQEVVWGRGAGIGIGSGEGHAAAVGTGTGGVIMIVIGADALFMPVKLKREQVARRGLPGGGGTQGCDIQRFSDCPTNLLENQAPSCHAFGFLRFEALEWALDCSVHATSEARIYFNSKVRFNNTRA
jgi:hypothetical protein